MSMVDITQDEIDMMTYLLCENLGYMTEKVGHETTIFFT